MIVLIIKQPDFNVFPAINSGMQHHQFNHCTLIINLIDNQPDINIRKQKYKPTDDFLQNCLKKLLSKADGGIY